MTLQQLTQYFKLQERLEQDIEMLESLQAAACPGSQILTGLPHTPGIRDKVGDLAIEIADMKEHICCLQAEITRQESVVTSFINSVDDEQMRTILRLRFLRCLTWDEVAAVIGGRNTKEGVKSACYRFLA